MNESDDLDREKPSEPDAESEPQASPYALRPDAESRVIEPPSPEPAQIGEAGRFIGTLLSPGAAFADINRKPTWVVPLIITLAASLGYFAIYLKAIEPLMHRGMRAYMEAQAQRENKPPPTDADIADMESRQKVVSYVFYTAWILIKYLFVAGALALAMMFLQAQTTFKKIWSVVLWSAAVTTVLEVLVIAAMMLTQSGESGPNLSLPASTTLAVLLPSDASGFLRALTYWVDIFSIWFLILLVIGLPAVGGARKITKSATAWTVFILWIIDILILAGLMVLSSGMFSGRQA